VMDISIPSGESETSLYRNLEPTSSGLTSETLVPIIQTTLYHFIGGNHAHHCENPRCLLGPCLVVGLSILIFNFGILLTGSMIDEFQPVG
jgi:hypothetical protein